MQPVTLPESFVARFLERLESCDQPLIRLWAWPWSGRRRLLEDLGRRHPDRWAVLPPHGTLIDHLARTDSGRGCRWLVAAGGDGSELLAAAERLGPGQRLVLPVERRVDDEVLPQQWLEPPAMRLRPAEIEELLAGAGSRQVEELARLSDGWIGPLVWLRDRGRAGEALATAFDGERFAARFHQRVTGRLDPRVSGALLECSLAEELDADLWRRVWIDRPDRLAALERLLWQWALIISEPPAAPRLPRLIRRAARVRDLPPDRRRELTTRLGLAAYALGRGAVAERYLSLAGDGPRLDRLRALGEVARTGSPAAAVRCDAAAVDAAAASRPPPRFALHFLGQPMVRRIDAGGEQRELDWRLRRAFLSLAFLVLAPDRRATKEQLVEAIWSEVPETSIAKNFHPTLSEARRTLGYRRVFVYRQGLYTLNPELDWWIDCERFVERIEQGRSWLAAAGGVAEVPEAWAQRVLDAWLEAWRLYRGELLAGIETDWIRPHRQTYYRGYIELLRGIGELCARLGQVTRALDAYRSVLLEEPYEEAIHLAVMELYARQGRRDLVRRQFVRMQELLLDELNVEPLEETQERYHQLMR